MTILRRQPIQILAEIAQKVVDEKEGRRGFDVAADRPCDHALTEEAMAPIDMETPPEGIFEGTALACRLTPSTKHA
ncbi:hypothetical protein [Bradyrhizobium sp. CCBAU 51627]|uniref:hypothetical protein n=1 Tax=Bradyrhizobium sp. CCBAU 51627 TaxID=1325088 RepID=UPI0023062B33|nr:hypothetical protein [Bradyrhizobium sp. CCBAU 51627]MDA9436050.1 hypothetical protein [Bradyrhizobium sp. CCBAU 51627]